MNVEKCAHGRKPGVCYSCFKDDEDKAKFIERINNLDRRLQKIESIELNAEIKKKTKTYWANVYLDSSDNKPTFDDYECYESLLLSKDNIMNQDSLRDNVNAFLKTIFFEVEVDE